MVRIFPLLLILLAASAQAEVYKCQTGGQIVYTDQACPGQGTVIAVQPPTSNSATRVDPGIQALADAFDARVQRRYAATVAANAPVPRNVPGVACPAESVIRQAIEDHEIALCMTPAEVDAAEPYDNDEQQVFNRLLPSGPSVVEWIYDPRNHGWPAVVRFDNNHVIGYSTNTPDYYRRRKISGNLYTD